MRRRKSKQLQLLKNYYYTITTDSDTFPLLSYKTWQSKEYCHNDSPTVRHQHAKATRRQWRHKRQRHWTEKKQVTKPGEVLVSVDQLISPTPGLVVQMTGILTKQRYTCATVYVDQYSGLGYVYLQKSTKADETIKGKLAFETYAKTVTSYHANNAGIFRSNKWMDKCPKCGQGLSFAGVNTHHSNGLAEQRICSLQDLARAMLIHQNKDGQCQVRCTDGRMH